ncbi:MAG: astB [Phycisphaerales bacterium]|nr:astB [Phycisphaerales bacterium]
MNAREVNFDALVGPTHNYAGLAYGNIASQKNKDAPSNPRQAALEGLAKMKFLADLGVPQAVLPPQLRPDLATLRTLGFTGCDAQVLDKTAKVDPTLLAAVSSSSAMWAANAATLSPSPDTADHQLHISPANLISQFHRSIEPQTTAAILRAIFPAALHHPPLPSQSRWSDEGAANHTRLCQNHSSPGLEIFVYGRDETATAAPKIYPARQTADASRALARRHQLNPDRTCFLQQNPAAIDAGVFHNDVAAVGNQNVFLCHAQAYLDQPRALAEIRTKFAALSPSPLHIFEIPDEELTLTQAVETYLFNSQIVTLPDGTMSLIAPAECEHHAQARAVIGRLLAAGTPLQSAHFLSVRQSMRNGGGPACLRLRVVLTDAELAATHPGVFLNDALYARLVAWINKHYREELRAADLADVKLFDECRAALDDLTGIIGLPRLYDFQ